MIQNPKVGDWVFSEHELKMIKRVQGERITDVTDGYFSHSSSDLTPGCFPLTIENKLVAEEVHRVYKKIHELENRSLNYPGICNYLENKFIEGCTIWELRDLNIETKEKRIQNLYNEVDQFYNQIRDKIDRSKDVVINQVKIFR